jgi:hypothetical protein
MEGLTDDDEIASNFWQQIAEIYPDLMNKSKGLTPKRLENIKRIITENKEKDAKAKREWNANQCEKCAQPLRDCLCDDN